MTTSTPQTWGWAGSVGEFLGMPRDRWIAALSAHLVSLLGRGPSGSQLTAWIDEHEIMNQALRTCINAHPAAADWSVIFEYELPMEGGRRPDVVLLEGSAVVVLEFKTGAAVRAADTDQAAAYSRDLADYHKASHGRVVTPMVVLTGAGAHGYVAGDEVVHTGPIALPRYLMQLEREGSIDLEKWLNSPYEPLPTLVAAAKRIFQHEPLPHVWTALSAGIPEALEYLLDVCRQSEANNGRSLAFITGVPGAGKTLVGLRLVYEGSTIEGRATFLSGNGPLVQVLQYVLQSRVFVRDLHAAILQYGKRGKTPSEHIIVFDEAQRAWGREHMARERDIAASEPDILVAAGERVPNWAVLVGLVGEGQEIYAGEEGGLPQWREAALPPNTSASWHVHCAPDLAGTFQGLTVSTSHLLDLTVSLRSRRAHMLHDWVQCVLDGGLSSAAKVAAAVYAAGFPMYITRNLQEAQTYAEWRYEGEDEKRFGLVASSHAKILPKFDVPNDFQSTKRVKYGPWYSAPRDDPKSCCQCSEVVTEFGCQGLELDLPIVCWGEDMRWDGTGWQLKPIRRKKPVDDPHQLLRNAYRVLLTRGRDGFVVYLPDADELNLTEHALLAAGIRPLPAPQDMPSFSIRGVGA